MESAPLRAQRHGMKHLVHDASPRSELQPQSKNTTLPPTTGLPQWPQETSAHRGLSLPVLLFTVLQAAFTAEINCGHHEEVCQHCDTPGLLQDPERNSNWGLSANYPNTTAAGSFPARTSPFSRRPGRDTGPVSQLQQNTRAFSAPALYRAGRSSNFSGVLHPPAWCYHSPGSAWLDKAGTEAHSALGRSGLAAQSHIG